MEALEALSLSGVIVQFIEFGTKLVSKSKELYDSADGLDEENAGLKTTSSILNQMSFDLSTTFSPSSVDERNLLELAKDCRTLSNELLRVLADIQGDPTRTGRLHSFRQALRHVRSKPQVDGMSERLDRFRSTLSLCLQRIIWGKQSRILRRLDELTDESHKLGSSTAEVLVELRGCIRNDIKAFKAEVVEGVLTTKLVGMRLECDRVERMNAILASLRYDAILDRHEQIAKAHLETFEWIFDPSRIDAGTNCPRPLLDEWLKSGNGIYWIAGKPASGKSTFVKWLCRHERTQNLLQCWAGRERLVVASHFFWSAGTAVQRSQAGLLRSLLFNAMHECPQLIPDVCCERWNFVATIHNARQVTGIGPWKYEELSSCFSRLCAQTWQPVKFCFIIDGLDEYDGDHDEVVDLLHWAAQADRVKICVSSRPWNVFQDAFGPSKQKLRLQDLTRGDIRRFTEDRLRKNCHFQKLQKRDPRCGELIEEIVNAADGVFLWVFLVVRSLLQGLTNKDTLSELQRRLRLLPLDLEQFFMQIFESTHEVYREQQAKLFLVANAAHDPLSLTTYSYIDDQDDDEDGGYNGSSNRSTPNIAGCEPSTSLKKFERIRRMHVRLNARCQGLLECISTSKRDERALSYLYCTPEELPRSVDLIMLSDYRVTFLHRTVKDFIATKQIDAFLKSCCPRNYKPPVVVCQALLAELWTLRYDERGDERSCFFIARLLGDLAVYAYETEKRYGAPLLGILDQLEEVFKHISPDVVAIILQQSASEAFAKMSPTNTGEIRFETWDARTETRHFSILPRQAFFKGFVVQNQLCRYASHKFRSDLWKPSDMKDLVIFAMLPKPYTLQSTFPEDENSSMLRLLLSILKAQGLNESITAKRPSWNASCEDRGDVTYECSAWATALTVIADLWTDPRRRDLEQDLALIFKMDICLNAGADPNVRSTPRLDSPKLFSTLIQGTVGLDMEDHLTHGDQSRTFEILNTFLQHGAAMDSSGLGVLHGRAVNESVELLKGFGYEVQALTGGPGIKRKHKK